MCKMVTHEEGGVKLCKLVAHKGERAICKVSIIPDRQFQIDNFSDRRFRSIIFIIDNFQIDDFQINNFQIDDSRSTGRGTLHS